MPHADSEGTIVDVPLAKNHVCVGHEIDVFVYERLAKEMLWPRHLLRPLRIRGHFVIKTVGGPGITDGSARETR